MPEEKYLVKHDASGKKGVFLYCKCLFETFGANLDQIYAKTLKNIQQIMRCGQEYQDQSVGQIFF